MGVHPRVHRDKEVRVHYLLFMSCKHWNIWLNFQPHFPMILPTEQYSWSCQLYLGVGKTVRYKCQGEETFHSPDGFRMQPNRCSAVLVVDVCIKQASILYFNWTIGQHFTDTSSISLSLLPSFSMISQHLILSLTHNGLQNDKFSYVKA